MRNCHKAALAALCFIASTSSSWSQSQTGPIMIPKKGDPGWDVTEVPDKSRPAPSGYEGRTDGSTLTAVGNAPETAGKKIVARFELTNFIKTCPNADGTAEGDGLFSLTIDATDTQPTGISRSRVDMRAVGKYKGEVGDDAWIKNPVKAEIEHTFRVSGGFQERRGGAIASAAGGDAAPQHLTFPFSVGGITMVPEIGPFSGGDPTKGHYAEAFGTGTVLTYWAGIYYSIAQIKWRQPGTCVDISFAPPSYTEKLIPGGKTTVKAEVKTKTAEAVKARFLNAQGYQGGGVSPSEGPSDVGAPITFTFVAPPQKRPKSGFSVEATSRAGVANGEWFAGLGTDWSGTISLTITNTGDTGENEMQTWNNWSATRVIIDVKDAKGTARGTTTQHYMSARRVKAARNGSAVVIPDSSETIDGSVEDSSPATVEVLYPTAGAYAIRVGLAFNKKGTLHIQDCNRSRGCIVDTKPMVMGPSAPSIDGKTDDPNRLRGSKTEVGRGGGYQGTGVVTTTTTWDLARQGKGQ